MNRIFDRISGCHFMYKNSSRRKCKILLKCVSRTRKVNSSCKILRNSVLTSTKRRYNGRYTSCLKTLQEQGGKYHKGALLGKGVSPPIYSIQVALSYYLSIYTLISILKQKTTLYLKKPELRHFKEQFTVFTFPSSIVHFHNGFCTSVLQEQEGGVRPCMPANFPQSPPHL